MQRGRDDETEGDGQGAAASAPVSSFLSTTAGGVPVHSASVSVHSAARSQSQLPPLPHHDQQQQEQHHHQQQQQQQQQQQHQYQHEHDEPRFQHPGQPDSPPQSTGVSPASEVRRVTLPPNQGPAVAVSSGHFSMQGIRPEMEDRVTLLPHPDFNRAGMIRDGVSRSFWAVFDGHGGDVSAEYCRQHVHNNLLLSPSFSEGALSDGLRSALVKTESDFCAACRRINLMTSSGTTAITAYLQADLLIVANIGDSRAVVCRSGRAVDASIDHKPGRKEERARIESLGGRVGITEEDAFRATPRPCPCLWACVSAGRPLRVFPGGLSVSRTIGDISMKGTALVSSEPELWESRLTAADEFLILACDGVWDVMNSQQAVDCVRSNLFRSNNNAEEASKHLANEAFRRGSTDNISVVVVTFQMPTPAKAAAATAQRK